MGRRTLPCRRDDKTVTYRHARGVGSSKSQVVKQKHGVSLNEAQEIFDQATWSTGRTTIRSSSALLAGAADAYVRLSLKSDTTPVENITTWSLPGGPLKRSRRVMPKTSKSPVSADEIAEKATRGENISAYFTNKFTVVRPVRRVNVDLSQGMLRELDQRAARLNISRQAVIKTLLDRALQESRPGRRTKREAG
jgi:hypothetical protein